MRSTAYFADRSGPDCNRQFSRTWATPPAELARQRACEHLVALGPRAVFGFLGDLERKIGHTRAIDELLAAYRARLSVDMMRAAGGDRFPPSVTVMP